VKEIDTFPGSPAPILRPATGNARTFRVTRLVASMRHREFDVFPDRSFNDNWDYDLESAPVADDVVHREKIPGVAMCWKARTDVYPSTADGSPSFGMEERPVPASDVPVKVSWPTQPFPLKRRLWDGTASSPTNCCRES